MCFSASASFTTATFLALTGAITLVRNREKTFVIFASIPLLFAIQQFCEGMLWTSFTNPNFEQLQPLMTTLFLFFAFVIWPIWTPVSLMLIEKQKLIKKRLKICVGIGVALALFLLVFLITQPIRATVQSNHIYYSFDAPLLLDIIATLFFLAATVLPFFITSYSNMKWFGGLLAASYVISYFFYAYAHISVWCFFVAVLSICIFAYVPK